MSDLRVSHKDGVLSVRLTKSQAITLAKSLELCRSISVLQPTTAGLSDAAVTAAENLTAILDNCTTTEESAE